jgi:hypothetical protein
MHHSVDQPYPPASTSVDSFGEGKKLVLPPCDPRSPQNMNKPASDDFNESSAYYPLSSQ